MLETLANKQALADGVLDRRGDLKEIKLRGGRQAFIERLEQILSTTTPKPAVTVSRPLPSDRPLGFAAAAARLLDGGLVTCEERYPREDAHSVLCVVVERDAALWRERLVSLHTEYFAQTDPLAPVRMEVIDRATHEAIERLIAAGVLTFATRSARPLFSTSETAASPPPLSPAELAKMAGLREKAARKLKMARVLGEAGLLEEARPPLLEAIHLRARALAVEHRLPEPDDCRTALLPPLAIHFGEALAPLRDYVANESADGSAAVAAMG